MNASTGRCNLMAPQLPIPVEWKKGYPFGIQNHAHNKLIINLKFMLTSSERNVQFPFRCPAMVMPNLRHPWRWPTQNRILSPYMAGLFCWCQPHIPTAHDHHPISPLLQCLRGIRGHAGWDRPTRSPCHGKYWPGPGCLRVAERLPPLDSWYDTLSEAWFTWTQLMSYR